MEATTTRASTVIRSIPTSETRTQASITMPLSSTRSRTSMRLVPPEALSTGIVRSLWLRPVGARRGPAFRQRSPARQGLDLAFQQADLLAQLLLLELGAVPAGREVLVVAPPVQADLLCLVDGAAYPPDANGQKLHLRERYLDVACDHEPLVEHAVEDVHEAAAMAASWLKFGSHGLGFLVDQCWGLRASSRRAGPGIGPTGRQLVNSSANPELPRKVCSCVRFPYLAHDPHSQRSR